MDGPLLVKSMTATTTTSINFPPQIGLIIRLSRSAWVTHPSVPPTDWWYRPRPKGTVTVTHNSPRRRTEPNHVVTECDHKFIIVLTGCHQTVRDVLRGLQRYRPIGQVCRCQPGLRIALKQRLEVVVDTKNHPELFRFLNVGHEQSQD